MTIVDVIIRLKEDLNIKMGSPECKEYIKSHSNCKGCLGINDCREYISRLEDLLILQVREAKERNLQRT